MSLSTTKSIDKIKFVAIHHSANAGVPVGLGQLRKRLSAHNESHRGRNYPKTLGEFGYDSLLYSFAIAGNGDWVQTQDLKYQLYHATDWYKGEGSSNQWGFGILLEGNFEVENPTKLQLESAAQIIYEFNQKNSTRLIIKGHKEFSLPRNATACPGKNMGLSTDPASRLSWIIKRVDELHETGGAGLLESKLLRARVTGTLNVRTGPHSKSAKIGQLPAGTYVLILDQVEGEDVNGVTTWCKFEFDGRAAYVHSSWLSADDV